MTRRLSFLLSTCLTAWIAQNAQGQIVWTEPAFPTQDDVVTLYYDVSHGNAALIDEEPPCPPCPFVYAHTGVITSESTSPSDWQYVHNPWPNGNNTSSANAGNTLIPLEGTIHSFDFGGLTLAEYYGVPDGVVIEQLAFVFRNANGSVVGKTADESDIFYNVSDGSFEVIFTSPLETSSIASLGEGIDIVAQATQPAELTLSINGEEVASAFGPSLSYTLSLDNAGDYVLDIAASADGSTVHSSATVFVMPESAPVLTPPAGIVDGINELNDSTVVLQCCLLYTSPSPRDGT